MLPTQVCRASTPPPPRAEPLEIRTPQIVRGSTYCCADVYRLDEGSVDDQIDFTLVGTR